MIDLIFRLIFYHWIQYTGKKIKSIKKAKEIVGSLEVVNDTAKRHVKLIEEFNSKITKNEEQKQILLQVNTFFQ